MDSPLFPPFLFHLFSSLFLFSLVTPPPCVSSPFIPFVLSMTLAHNVFWYFPQGAKQNVCDIFQIYCCIFLLSLKKYRKLLRHKSYWSKHPWHYFVKTRCCCSRCGCCCCCLWGGGGGGGRGGQRGVGLEINCWLIFSNGKERWLAGGWRETAKEVFINGWISWVLLLLMDQFRLALIGCDTSLGCSLRFLPAPLLQPASYTPFYCLIRGHNRPWLKSTLQCEIKAAVLCKIYVSVSHKCMFLTSGIYVDSGDLCGSLAVRIQCFSFRDHFFSLSVRLSFSHSLSYCLSLSISHCFSPFLSHSVSLSFSVFTVSPLSNYNFLMYTLFTCSNMLMALHAVSLGVSSVVALCATWDIVLLCCCC